MAQLFYILQLVDISDYVILSLFSNFIICTNLAMQAATIKQLEMKRNL